jgi:hypothetical protein
VYCQGVEPSLQSKRMVGICFSVLLIDSGYVKPIVDRVLLLSQASQAYEGGKSFHKHGKIVLLVI